jgi:hypothetical protein
MNSNNFCKFTKRLQDVPHVSIYLKINDIPNDAWHEVANKLLMPVSFDIGAIEARMLESTNDWMD